MLPARRQNLSPSLLLFWLFFTCAAFLLSVETQATAADGTTNPDSRDRSTAVALNYCRASFHRIRQNPSKRVMLEEQEKILNNLNLDGIADEAVIKLYTSVLDEISEIDIAEQEIDVLQEKFKKTLHREIGGTALAVAAQMATLSFERAVYTGVNSWLDYRDMSWTREFDTWKVEKTRITAVVDKSSKFLDTFWKLTQSRNIPDRWLVRGNDLDDLTAAIEEPNLEKRLRILKRMEPFMECYPPYWYYLARTQQGLGDFAASSETYNNLANLGHGFFRRDDMMASSLANLAVMQTYLNQPGADKSARQALAHSPDVWQANLMAAQVLEKHGQLKDAEDAILRNIDVDLETTRSTVALVGMYYRQHQSEKLAQALANEDTLAALPILSLMQAAAELARTHPIPPATIQRLRTSIRVAVEPKFGDDDLIIACEPAWQSELAQVAVVFPGPADAARAIRQSSLETHPSGETVIRFSGVVDGGNPLRPSAPQLAGTTLLFEFPQGTQPVAPLVVVLGDPASKSVSATQATAPWWTAASPSGIRYGNIRLDLHNPNLPQAEAIAAARSAAQENPTTDAAVVKESAGSLEQSSRSPVTASPDSQSPRRTPRVTIIGIHVREASRDTAEPLQNLPSNDAEPAPLKLPPPPPPS
jgi:tetratricopeptide (TPR) repeat protein